MTDISGWLCHFTDRAPSAFKKDKKSAWGDRKNCRMIQSVNRIVIFPHSVSFLLYSRCGEKKSEFRQMGEAKFSFFDGEKNSLKLWEQYARLLYRSAHAQLIAATRFFNQIISKIHRNVWKYQHKYSHKLASKENPCRIFKNFDAY